MPYFHLMEDHSLVVLSTLYVQHYTWGLFENHRQKAHECKKRLSQTTIHSADPGIGPVSGPGDSHPQHQLLQLLSSRPSREAPATGPATSPSSPPIGRSKGKEWRKFKTEIQAVIGEDASDAFLSCMPSSALRACRLVLSHLVRTPALWSTWKSGKSHPLSKVPCDS